MHSQLDNQILTYLLPVHNNMAHPHHPDRMQGGGSIGAPPSVLTSLVKPIPNSVNKSISLVLIVLKRRSSI